MLLYELFSVAIFL